MSSQPETIFTIDPDLTQAEAHAANLAKALTGLVHPARAPFEAAREAITALEEWKDYCRPSCGYLDGGDCAMSDGPCGCPCGHDDTNAIADHPPTSSPR